MKYPGFKGLLSRVGASCSDRTIHKLNGVLNYLYIGWWMRDRGFTIPARYSGREELYQHLAPKVEEPLSYLEFGVFRGTSMRRWSKIFKHPETTMSGFDSFEGLPETWRMAADKSTFDVKGELPRIDDPRVRFFKGWFQDTVPAYLEEFPPKKSLVLHLDADLYSSTIYILNLLKDRLQPGVLLVFDELFDREHELKALEEFINENHIGLECVGATRALTQVAFRVTSPPVAKSAATKVSNG
jgi:O-methyltransferase